MGGKAPDVEPRVHVFKDESAPKPAERDEKGRPKIRWAHYDSDVAEEEEDVVEGDAAGEETEEESDET